MPITLDHVVGFLVAVALMIVYYVGDWLWTEKIKPWRKDRQRIEVLENLSDFDEDEADHDVPPRAVPAPAPRPTVRPPTQTPIPPVEESPGRETQAMPVVKPSMFVSPPPPLPTSYIVTPAYEGPERRVTDDESYEGPERRSGGRHADPDNKRAKRSDDPMGYRDKR